MCLWICDNDYLKMQTIKAYLLLILQVRLERTIISYRIINIIYLREKKPIILITSLVHRLD